MKENRIFSIITKQYKYYKKGNESVSLVRNVLNRDFSTETINEKWVSDITYIWSRKEGWCYLSSIMDLYSNRIISHKVGKFMDIKLVMETLKEAYYVRGRKSNIIIHTTTRRRPRPASLRSAHARASLGAQTVRPQAGRARPARTRPST